MPNCNEFQNLLPRERTEYIGQLIHACMSDTAFFVRGQTIIKQAEKIGLFDGVTILPPSEDEPFTNQNNIDS